MQKTLHSVFLHALSCLSILPIADAAAVVAKPGRDAGDWRSYSKSIFLPFVYEFSSNRTPEVYGSILGKNFQIPVDTGSTGFLIGATKLPEVPVTHGTPGYEFLDSSSLLYSGTYVNVSITFKGDKGSRAVSRVPVLIVHDSWYCPTYKVGRDTDKCPDKNAKKNSLDKILYMGVGYGRNKPGTGVLGTPDYNPFLNVQTIDGKRVNGLNFRTGYVLGTAGVSLGLTLGNTNEFAWTGLDKGATADPRDWSLVNMSFTVNDKGNYRGQALIDTGIPQMYIQSLPVAPLPNITVKDPLNPKLTIKTVKPGTKLEIGFPEIGPKNIGGYAFKVGNNIFPSQPYFVQAVSVGVGPHVNTGRKFLHGFNVAFDADGGKFGIYCKLCSKGNDAGSTAPTSALAPSKPSGKAKVKAASTSGKKQGEWDSDDSPWSSEETSDPESDTKQNHAWDHDDSWKSDDRTSGPLDSQHGKKGSFSKHGWEHSGGSDD